MNCKKTTLQNGVRILTVPFENMESATVTIWSAVGSRHESQKVSGVSHFLEHMVFKGSQKRPTAREISETVDGLGAEFNAGTSKEWTNFYIKVRRGVIDTAFDVLADMVLNPVLREEDIEREKGVIIEEIGMYEDSPRRRVFDLFEQTMFKGSQLGRDIIGTRETVKAITKKDFVAHRKKHYKAQNILVTVAGGVDEKHIHKLAKKYFADLPSENPQSYMDSITPFKENQKSPNVFLSSQKREQTNFVLGFFSNKRDAQTRYTEGILASILGGGMSSRLFTEIREKRGLAYTVHTNTEHFPDIGYIETYAGVDPKRADEALKVTLDQIYGLASGKYPITDEELTRAREYIKGHIALSLEDTTTINHFFGEEELILGKIRTPEEVYSELDKVTKEDIVLLAKKIFVPTKLNLAIIGPYKTDTKFAKIVTQ